MNSVYLAYFRFYAELNDLLPPNRRQVGFAHHFKERGSIKDVIEALGVPHTEVDLILVNGESVAFSYLVQDGDRISVYPLFTSIDINSVSHVRPLPLCQTRFVLDVHLGKLATYLRLLGFDTLYRNDYQDEELAYLSSSDGRILLTKDRGLLKRSMVMHGYLVRESDPWLQLFEVLRRFELFGASAPFQRCLRCNGLLQPVRKKLISDRLLPKTRQYYDEFCVCQVCSQIYWKGPHYERMQQFINRVLQHDTSL
jgi:uncharacterized protein with PIN domain